VTVWDDLDRPPLRAASLVRGLVRDGSPWTEVRVLEVTGSTNADVAAAARAGAPAGLVVVAEAQVSGRGRLGREWSAPPRSGLTFSVLLRPTFPRAHWGWLPLLAGLAVASAVRHLGELAVSVKWPNDVLVGERKLAGVLAEVVGDAVAVGIGLNVSLRADELPVPTATSLAIEGAEVEDRDPLLRAVLREIARSYKDLTEAGGDAEAAGLRSAYLAASGTVGRAVRLELPDGRSVTGLAEGVDADGALVVDGTAWHSGDVVHVR